MTKTEMDPEVRERLLEAMLGALEAKGRKGIALAEVLAGAEVSEAEFSAEYADVDSCLDAAYEELTARLGTAVRVGCRSGEAGPLGASGDWPTRVRGGLEALLAELAADPPMARTLIRSFPALGNTAQARYQAFVESFAALLAEGREGAAVEEELPAGVELLAVGAAEAIVFEEVTAGRTEELPKIASSILFSLLVPFIGPGEATAEMEKARSEH